MPLTSDLAPNHLVAMHVVVIHVHPGFRLRTLLRVALRGTTNSLPFVDTRSYLESPISQNAPNVQGHPQWVTAAKPITMLTDWLLLILWAACFKLKASTRVRNIHATGNPRPTGG
jgi:hypothetical protein